jgi:hypothetical protein
MPSDDTIKRELVGLDKKRTDLAERINAAESNRKSPRSDSPLPPKSSIPEKRNPASYSVVRAFKQEQKHEHKTQTPAEYTDSLAGRRDSSFDDRSSVVRRGISSRVPPPGSDISYLSVDEDWQRYQEERRQGAPALRSLMRVLGEQGLKPDGVPPHRDSFFLALVKGLHRVGLCPKGYNFEPDEVLGSRSQFPQAAKRARLELLRILSARAPLALNDKIAGWRLSSAEFCRYFSKAWWQVPAARNDLFTAAAHHFRVSIECLTVQDGELVRETFVPPDGSAPLARIVLCRFV